VVVESFSPTVMACRSKLGRGRPPSPEMVGVSWELKLPGPIFAVAYDDCPPRDMTLATAVVVADDKARPSLVRLGARREPWSVIWPEP
jgi:hypothetical protein